MKKFILGLAAVLCLFGVTGCDSNATTSNEAGETENVQKDIKTYGLNEDIYVTNDYGKYRLKITGVRESSERNEFDDTKVDRAIIISYEYENISKEDDLYIASMSFKAYDKDNNALETYESISYKYADSISTGRKTNAEMVWALNNENNYIELEFYDNMFNSSSDCKIKLEW